MVYVALKRCGVLAKGIRLALNDENVGNRGTDSYETTRKEHGI
jgi:hypothetical protein